MKDIPSFNSPADNVAFGSTAVYASFASRKLDVS